MPRSWKARRGGWWSRARSASGRTARWPRAAASRRLTRRLTRRCPTSPRCCAHGMGPRDVVKVAVFLTERGLLGPWRAKRDAFVAGHAPASTVLFVAGLAEPRFVVEVEAEAAAA